MGVSKGKQELTLEDIKQMSMKANATQTCGLENPIEPSSLARAMASIQFFEKEGICVRCSQDKKIE